MGEYRIARRLSEAPAVVESFVGVELKEALPVVVKRLVSPWAQNPGFVQRYLGIGRVPPRGPGLPNIHEVGLANDTLYVVQELVEGESLRRIMRELAVQNALLAPSEGLALVGRVADLLSQLHTQPVPVVHGDLCASSILLTPGGEVCLVDAGIATAAGATAPYGPARTEPQTLAPEQLQGVCGPATDVFRLGLVLYELALGRPLFVASDSPTANEACGRFTGLKREGLKQVPEPYASLLVEMLAVDPERRPQAEQISAILDRALARAGWSNRSQELTRLFARAFPQRQSLFAALTTEGAALTLLPVENSARPPGSTPPLGAVVAKISTRRVSQSELDAIRASALDVPAPVLAPDIENERSPRDLILGRALLEKGLLTRAQLTQARQQAEARGELLADTLLTLAFVAEDAIVAAMAELTKTPSMTSKKLAELDPSKEALACVSHDLACRLNLVPLALKGGTQLVVAMREPMNGAVLEQLKSATGLKNVVAVRAGEQAIRETRNRFYTGSVEDDVSDWLETSTTATHPVVVSSIPAIPLDQQEDQEDLTPVAGQLLNEPVFSQEVWMEGLLRLGETLLLLLGDKGRQAQTLVEQTQRVAQQLRASEEEILRAKAIAMALVTASLRDGQAPWEWPTLEALSGVLGPAFASLEAPLTQLLDFPQSLPGDAAGLAVCTVFAFSTHAREPKPLPRAAERAMASFRVRFRFPPQALEALTEVLRLAPAP